MALVDGYVLDPNPLVQQAGGTFIAPVRSGFVVLSSTSTTTVFYKMVGKDSACPTLTYHAWVVQNTPDFTGSQAGTLPCGGPLVDIYIADTWT